MLPHPLHPAVVHFPLVLVILLPFFAAGALWAIRRGTAPRRAWALPLAVTAALFVSGVVALSTGRAEEERVEGVVPEAAVSAHEEAAERFLIFGGALLLVAAAGLGRGHLGTSARLLTMVGSLAFVAAGIQVGGAGGALVYQHGAAGAYADGRTPIHPRDSAELRTEREGRGDREGRSDGREGQDGA
jgi:uncharacterized membrane protein